MNIWRPSTWNRIELRQKVNLAESAGRESVINYVILKNYDMIKPSLKGLGPTDTWLKYCGTAGKPGGQKEKTNINLCIGRNRSTRPKSIKILEVCL